MNETKDLFPSDKKKKPAADEPHYLGHRQRLKQKFLKNGGKALEDYELLELVLFLALPRRDVKPLAKELIKYFGSYTKTLAAPPEDLQKVKGVGETVVIALKTVYEASVRLSQKQAHDLPVVKNWQAIVNYCRSSMGYLKKEQFRVLFLNKKNQIMADELQQEGTVDFTPVFPREIVKRALDLGAYALVLIHNHPSGDATPSKQDIEMTRQIAKAAAAMDLQIYDHLIISQNDECSFRQIGYL